MNGVTHIPILGATSVLALALLACTGAKDDEGEDEETEEAQTSFDFNINTEDLAEIALIQADLEDVSGEEAVVGQDNLLTTSEDLVAFYNTTQPEVNEPSLTRQFSRATVESALGRTFVLADGESGIVQILLMFDDGEGAARFLSSEAPGYDGEGKVARETESLGDGSFGYEGEFRSELGPTGFATVLARYDNVVSQVIVGTIGVEDPFVAAQRLAIRADERLLDFIAGDDLVTLAEELQVTSAPDPRLQQMYELLLVPGDLADYGTFEVLTETPNNDAESVVAFLSNAESIVPELTQQLSNAGFITGYGRLLSNGQQDEQGMAIISQALLFESAEGAAGFVDESTDLDLEARAGNRHEVMAGDAARAFCRQRTNQNWDCEVRFSRDNIFAAVAVLNFAVETEGLAAATTLALTMDELIQERP
jgi:hypothetical protein